MFRHRDHSTTNHPLRASLRLVHGGKEASPQESPLSELQRDTFLRAHYLEKPKDKSASDQLTLFTQDKSTTDASVSGYDGYDN